MGVLKLKPAPRPRGADFGAKKAVSVIQAACGAHGNQVTAQRRLLGCCERRKQSSLSRFDGQCKYFSGGHGCIGRRCCDRRAERSGRWTVYARKHPDLAQEFQQMMRGELPAGWDADIPDFPADPKGMKTRVASGKVMSAIAPKLPAIIAVRRIWIPRRTLR
jgi:hypothetical protein